MSMYSSELILVHRVIFSAKPQKCSFSESFAVREVKVSIQRTCINCGSHSLNNLVHSISLIHTTKNFNNKANFWVQILLCGQWSFQEDWNNNKNHGFWNILQFQVFFFNLSIRYQEFYQEFYQELPSTYFCERKKKILNWCYQIGRELCLFQFP